MLLLAQQVSVILVSLVVEPSSATIAKSLTQETQELVWVVDKDGKPLYQANQKTIWF